MFLQGFPTRFACPHSGEFAGENGNDSDNYEILLMTSLMTEGGCHYAFGLTKIKFLHYALATFVFMLPACVAFIVFSSSLLDVIRGKISAAFIVGLGLIILVSLIPLFYRPYKTKKNSQDLI